MAGANLIRANLTEANFRGALSYEIHLEEAQLVRADLEHAHLIKAKLSNANLNGANMRMARASEAELSEASLIGTIIRDADLQDADLSTVKGLLARQLAGANVSGAKLPGDISKFEGLGQVKGLSGSVKKLFTALLLGCVYCWLTIFSTTDVRLLTNSASTPLPIIQTPIPIAGFYGVAPFILLAIFIYFHLYLQHLWRELASLPAVFPDGKPLDEKAHPWLLNSLVRAHVVRLSGYRPPLSRLENGLSILLAWWTVPFTIAIFWIRSLQRHDWVLTGFLIGFLVISVVCALRFQLLAKTTFRGQQSPPIRSTGNQRQIDIFKETFRATWKLVGVGLVVVVLALVISDGAINGVISDEFRKGGWDAPWHRTVVPRSLPYVGARAFADLDEKEASTRPLDWYLRPDDDLPRGVQGAQLRQADLRYARAFAAFLTKADLRSGQLQKAYLAGAQLQQASLINAQLQGASLSAAKLQGANLGGANLQNTNLFATRLQEANLYGAQFQGANLVRAQLQGAYLVNAVGLTQEQLKKLVLMRRRFCQQG